MIIANSHILPKYMVGATYTETPKVALSVA